MSTRASSYYQESTGLHVFRDVGDGKIYIEITRGTDNHPTIINLTHLFGEDAANNLNSFFERHYEYGSKRYD